MPIRPENRHRYPPDWPEILSDWRARCARPAVSCSGGKDSTALLLLTMRIDPTIPVYRADPPNPLPDRPAHVDRLQRAVAAPWVIVPYPWDVDAVLDGHQRYPKGCQPYWAAYRAEWLPDDETVRNSA